MALTNKTFSDLITFARTGTATRVNAAGLIEDVAANTPRFDHDPVTGAAKGLLIEEARTNVLHPSSELTDSNWSSGDAAPYRATVIPYDAVAPDGTVTASRITDNSTSGTHRVVYAPFTKAASAVAYTFSVFLKAGTLNFASLKAFNSGEADYAAVGINLTTGALSTPTNSGFTSPSAVAEQFGNGWWRLSLTFTSDADTDIDFAVQTGDSLASNPAYVGSGQYIWAWGAQVEQADFSTSYIDTSSSFTSRASTATYTDSAGVMQTAAIDEARTGYKLINGTWTSMGLLLEAAATNLALRSEEFDNASWTKSEMTVTANAATAPDGAMAMDKLIPSSTNTANHQVEQSISVTNGTGYTLSCFMQAAGYNFGFLQQNYSGGGYATFNLLTGEVDTISGVDAAGIEDLGGGVYRCWIYSVSTETASRQHRVRAYNASGVPSFAGDTTSGIYAWGIQAEANSYATSYIPTTTATVTRSADVSSSSTVTRNADDCSIIGTAFSDWYNASEGTVYIEVSGNDTNNANSSAFTISDGTNNERITAVVGTTNHLFVADGGATQAALDAGGFTDGVPSKLAIAFNTNDFAACLDGGTVLTDTSGTLPTVDRMIIGANAAGNNAYLNGHIKNIKFYPSRLTNAELQALTT